MKKRIIYYIIGGMVFLAIFEFYIFYLWPQDMNFGSFFSYILNSVVAPETDKTIRINLYNKSLTLIEGEDLLLQDKIAAAGDPRSTPTPTGNFKVTT